MTSAPPSNSRPTPTSRGATAFVVRPTHLATLLAQLDRKSDARVVVVQVRGSWAGGELLAVGNRSWRVVRASSVLAIRESLVEHEDSGSDARLVILTALDTQDLGWDVLARIAKQRVLLLESWELLQDLFRAHGVDPRVARLGWLADVLLDHAPPGGYPAAPSGVLDLDTAWKHALAVLLGMPNSAPDALTILRWSLRDGVATRWSDLADEVRRGVADRLGETAGALGRVLAAAIEAGRGDQLLPLGLSCGALWPDVALDDTSIRDVLSAARVRLEPLVGGQVPTEKLARDWSDLARRLLNELPADRAAGERARAERLLEEVRAESAAELSSVLPAGATRRAVRLGGALAAWLRDGGSVTPVEESLRRFVEHEEIEGTARAERAEMAARLVRALVDERAVPVSSEASGFAPLVRAHVLSGSWFDAARVALMAGDTVGELSSAYAELLRRARARREQENQRFADRLALWNQHPTAEPDLVPVERVVDQVVAPIADSRTVLVLLIDGMDLGVWRQLQADLTNRGWTWWRPVSASMAPVAVAMLPSVTTFSRTSLFAGEAMAGTQQNEKQLFATHHALARSTVSGRRPLLFHKGDLGGADGLSPDVRRAIGDEKQRVVGAVINAIDDWLDKSDQVTPRWSVSAIPLLEALLQEAAQAERAVVVLSDHGHLLDHDTSVPRSGESARWRSLAAGPVSDGEVVVSGGRVRAVTGQESVVLAVSESMRYTGKKTGYHGGASPQEVVAPIAVLSRDELGVDGWRPVLDSSPAWWGAPSVVDDGRTAGAGAEPARRQVQAPPTSDGELVPGPRSAGVGGGEIASAPWIQLLLASPLLAVQRDLAGRVAPREEQLRLVLETLDRFNGRAPRTAIASALTLSEMRVRGVVAGARRLLNVEGFAVLEEEESTGALTLNRELLRVQFGLAE